MRNLTVYWLLIGILFSPSVIAGDAAIKSLRGNAPLDQTNPPPEIKHWQEDRKPYPRDYVQQPPLIPHKIKGYKINLRSNKCLTCHSWKNYQESGATKISLTHFKDRDGNELDAISPRRYFCTQCHVPQKNVQPLVGNRFSPIQSLERR